MMHDVKPAWQCINKSVENAASIIGETLRYKKDEATSGMRENETIRSYVQWYPPWYGSNEGGTYGSLTVPTTWPGGCGFKRSFRIQEFIERARD